MGLGGHTKGQCVLMDEALSPGSRFCVHRAPHIPPDPSPHTLPPGTPKIRPPARLISRVPTTPQGDPR